MLVKDVDDLDEHCQTDVPCEHDVWKNLRFLVQPFDENLPANVVNICIKCMNVMSGFGRHFVTRWKDRRTNELLFGFTS